MTLARTQEIQRIEPQVLTPEIVRARDYELPELEAMAKHVIASGSYLGYKRIEQVVTMMMICQADGLHPIDAVRRFHMTTHGPAMRATAIQAEFQKHGGYIRERTVTKSGAAAKFFHPIHCPEGEVAGFDESDARAAGVFETNPNYRKYPEDMYWSRTVARGVRRIMPGILVGIYTEEEVQDFAPPEQRSAFDHLPMPSDSPPPPKAIVKAPPRKEAVRLASQVGDVDPRPYHEIVKAETDAYLARASEAGLTLELKGPQVHQHMLKWAAAVGLATKPEGPLKLPVVVETMQAVYSGESRDRVREEIAAYCASKLADAEDAAKAAVEAPTETREPGDEG